MKVLVKSIVVVLAIVGILSVAKSIHFSGTTIVVETKPEGLAKQGKQLLASKGCIACHTDNGERLVGPTFKGNFGKKRPVDINGEDAAVLYNEAYIRESIEYPQAKIVIGYPPSMPSYRGLLNDEEIVAITEYIKSIK